MSALKNETDEDVKQFVFDGVTDLTRADPDDLDEDDFVVPGETYEEIKAALNDTGIELFEDDSLEDILRDHPHMTSAAKCSVCFTLPPLSHTRVG